MQVRERYEQSELGRLSQYSCKSGESRGREVYEEPDPLRTCFQRDRDRILHSKAFRRLMHKTQVFISPAGDHYRTRLTHTLEVAQIARTIARALLLNEDLTEAIALGHDLGHTPFGHAGESALDEAIRERQPSLRFRHYEQSLRVVTVIENLNLTWETREGIEGHSKGRADLTAFDGEKAPSLEAAVVRVSDRIAYLNHDLDDALRAGWLSLSSLPESVARIGSTHSERIGAMVGDLVTTSLDKPTVSFSEEMLTSMNAMKEYLFENLYLEYPRRFPDIRKAQGIVTTLFGYYADEPSRLPQGYEGFQGAIDYVSGMTDRYASRLFIELFVPDEWTTPL